MSQLPTFFFYIEENEDQAPQAFYYYLIDDYVYDGQSMSQTDIKQGTLIQSFTVNINRSQIISLVLKCGSSYIPMLYQWDFNENRLYELTTRPQGYEIIERVDILNVPNLTIPRENRILPQYDLKYPNDAEHLVDNFVALKEPDPRFPSGITNEEFNLILQIQPTLIIDNLYYNIQDNAVDYYYYISGKYYNATNLSLSDNNNNLVRFSLFEVYLENPNPFILLFANDENKIYPMVYQVRDVLIELTPRPPSSYNKLINVTKIVIPMSTSKGVFSYDLLSGLAFFLEIKRLIGITSNEIFDHISQIEGSLNSFSIA